MDAIFDRPVSERFPDLSSFVTIVRDDGAFLLGAGILCDGLIVPLFPDEAAAREVIANLAEDPRDLRLSARLLGDPFQAMRKAAGEGAAGFQFSPGAFTEAHVQRVFTETAGRVLFPFMTRRDEAGGLWPTVLGSASRCDAGIYLSRRGQVRFGPHDLCQWVRWDVMDRASAKLAVAQPFRSHDDGDPFWCLSHAAGHVNFITDGQRFEIQSPALVLFAQDHAMRQFMPPEGYYPVFVSEQAAADFLEERLGGAFHIVSLGKSEIPNHVMHHSLMAQDLGRGGALIAQPVQVQNLPRHLAELRELFQLPPYAAFVINPVGHREDLAWGRFADAEDTGVTLKSVGGSWRLDQTHAYSLSEQFDQFSGEDTFFLGPSEFRFADLRRSLGRFKPLLGGEDLRQLTAVEAEELIRDFVIRGAEDPLVEDVMGRPADDMDDERHLGAGDPADEDDQTASLSDARAYAPLLGRWVLNFWETVDGERLGPSYFETPFHLARALCRLELEDRPVRVEGRHGHTSIGFEGSGNQELEDAGGAGFATAIVRICQRMVERGYQPRDALDMAAAANAVLRSYRISLCANAADALISHIPDEARSSDRLMCEMGLPEEIREQLVELVEAQVDPEGDALLRRWVGDAAAERLPARTRLFLATALLQFEGMGNSPCIDYAPVSVQVVKALEFEMRELAAAAVEGFGEATSIEPVSREEETLFHVVAKRATKISLGSITHAFRAARKAKGGILRHACDRLEVLGMADVMRPATVTLVLRDVLERFRNGGAHEHAISHATCLECIQMLVGSDQQPGLVLRVSRWRARDDR